MENNSNETQTAPETNTADTQQETTPATTQEEGVTTTSNEDSFFDSKTLPAELMPAYKNMQASYTKKTQEIADVRKKADAFNQLSSYQPFLQWYDKHTKGETDSNPDKESGELTDDEFSLLMSDKKLFTQYVSELAKQQALPVAEEAKRKALSLQREMEIKDFGKEYPDFWTLDKQGLIEPLMRKYPNADIEDVYKMANYDFLEQQAIAKAHGIVQQKKAASVEKTGLPSTSSPVVKVKSREEAMSLAYDAAVAGKPVPEFVIEP